MDEKGNSIHYTRTLHITEDGDRTTVVVDGELTFGHGLLVIRAIAEALVETLRTDPSATSEERLAVGDVENAVIGAIHSLGAGEVSEGEALQ